MKPGEGVKIASDLLEGMRDEIKKEKDRISELDDEIISGNYLHLKYPNNSKKYEIQ